MQNIPFEFDLLVIGDEPAGLWLLREYSDLYSVQASIKAQMKKQASLGWLRFDEPLAPSVIPLYTARYFNIQTSTTFSAEIVSNRSLFRWGPEKVFSHFSSLPKELLERFQQSMAPPNSKEREKIRLALKHQPELLTFSQALWKQIGRCRQMTPESMIWAALQALELAEWDPESLIPSIPGLQTINLNDTQWLTALEEVKHPDPNIKGKIFKLTLSSGTTLHAKSLVLNCDLRHIKKLNIESTLQSWAPIPASISSRFCHYPINLEFNHFKLPMSVQPITIFLDQEVLPEPDTEMWPMSFKTLGNRKSLTLWATDRTEFSYEGLSESLQKAMGRLHHLFPEALRQVVHQSIPLGLESCYSETHRANAIEAIENSRQELYGLSLLHVRSRKRRFYSLLPALRCTLPYPLGTLLGAQEILRELFSRKTMQNYRPQTGVNLSTSP